MTQELSKEEQKTLNDFLDGITDAWLTTASTAMIPLGKYLSTAFNNPNISKLYGKMGHLSIGYVMKRCKETDSLEPLVKHLLATSLYYTSKVLIKAPGKIYI